MNKNASAILIVSLLLISGFTISIYATNSIGIILAQPFVGKIITSQQIPGNPNTPGVRDLKYTLGYVKNTFLRRGVSGLGLLGISYALANGHIYVIKHLSDTLDSNTVSEANTTTNIVINNIQVGPFPVSMAYDPLNGYIYVASEGLLNTIVVISTTTSKVIKCITVGYEPDAVAYDPLNGYIYVANELSDDVSVINGTTNTVINCIQVGTYPDAITYNSVNGYIYVANSESDDISVINGKTNTVIGCITVGKDPLGIAFDPTNGYIYVTNAGSNTVSVINSKTNKVIESIVVGEEPAGIIYDPSNGYIYVSNSGSNTVSVINSKTNSVIENITVGKDPLGIAFDPTNGYIYVTNAGSNTVSVINSKTNSVIENISVGSFPDAILYDPSNGYIYVANSGSGTISVISTSSVVKLYTITFIESGLPSGTTWTVALNGTIETSTTDTISFNEPNGTYYFSIENVSGYAAIPSFGKIIVSGKNVTQEITFTVVNQKPTSTNTELYAIVGIIIAVIVVGITVFLFRSKR